MKKIILLVVIILSISCVKNSKTQLILSTPKESNNSVSSIQTIKDNSEIRETNNQISLPNFRKINILIFKGKLVVIGNQLVLNDGYEDKVQIWSSVDGINWVKEVDNLMSPWRSYYAIANNQDRIIIFGGCFKDNIRSDELYYSNNIHDWEKLKQDNSLGKIEEPMVFYFQNNFWLIGESNLNDAYDIWNSKDGLIWTRTIYIFDKIKNILYDNNELNVNDEYLLFYDYSRFYKTTNGTEWEKLNIDIEKILYNIENTEVDNLDFCYFNNNFYASACINSWAEDTGFSDGYVPTTVIYRSKNLTDWELLSKKKDIPYINGKSEYKLMYDSLPFHWNAGFISFKEHLYIIGTDGDVWRSKDGVKWELISGNLPVFENRGD